MRLRSRPVLFARALVDAAVTRPFFHALRELRRAGEPAPGVAAAPSDPLAAPSGPPAAPRPIPRAA